MRVDEFDFDLPEERIALRPASPRDAARLLVVRPAGGLEDRRVGDLPELLRAGDVLVFNDTKVIPAQLHGVRERDGKRDRSRRDADRADRRCDLVGAGEAGPAARGRRPHPLRARGPRLPARHARRDGRGKAAGRPHPARLRLPRRLSRRGARTRSATRRCRPTSPRAGRPTSATARTTRPSMPPRRAPSPRRRRACTSRRS